MLTKTLRVGDEIEFIKEAGKADWWGVPGLALCFHPGYLAGGKRNRVAEVSLCRRFFRTDAYDTLWAPVSACQVVKSIIPAADEGQPYADLLRRDFPHGHPDFIPRMMDLVKLHSDKNHDYAMGGPPLGNFERVSHIMAMYPDFPWATPHGAATVYMLKQFDAFMWQTKQGFTPKVEGTDPRLRDVTVYSILIAIMLYEQNQRVG